MPASCSDRAATTRLAGAAAIAALCACSTRQVDVKPFRLEAVVVATGASLAAEAPTASLISLVGPATRVDETTLDVTDPQRGAVRLRFDRSAAPALAFPARLSGQDVRVELFVAPGQAGPAGGEILPIVGLRVATQPATPTYELLLGETSSQAPGGDPDVPLAFRRVFGDEDIPDVDLLVDYRDPVYARCGAVYFAALSLLLADQTIVLRRDEQAQVVVGSRPDPLHVLHVVSYQRRGTCAGQSETWTQIAAWR